MKFVNFSQVEEFLYSRIVFEKQHLAEEGMGRMKRVMSELDDPQDKTPVIHVAGTSGKGSIVWYLSKLLIAHGKRVGTMISPHMTDIRERAQINCEPLAKGRYTARFNEYMEQLRSLEGYELLEYISLLNSFAFYLFAQEEVDYAVVETGMGGRLDYTNVINKEDKISVLGRIGMDHVRLLGDSIGAIAREKLGIVKRENLMVALRQGDEINSEFAQANTKASRLVWVDVPQVRAEEETLKIDYTDDEIRLDDLMIGSKGLWQGENVAVALTTFSEVAKRDGVEINIDVVRKVMRDTKFLGRMTERNVMGRDLILDGAHNEQKMKALIESLLAFYPDRKFDILLSFKEGKDIDSMLKRILPMADRIYLTPFFVGTKSEKMAMNTAAIAGKINQMGYGAVKIHKSVEEAIRLVLGEKSGNLLVITGSLYMLSEAYKELEKYE